MCAKKIDSYPLCIFVHFMLKTYQLNIQMTDKNTSSDDKHPIYRRNSCILEHINIKGMLLKLKNSNSYSNVFCI